eukprot:TRINITY_DN2927_c0_g1_i3.p1 TRINITY_DN2927_c0_g1~~TRINITY_DN2927_c0_g1_i3.p1  ORF type:complete len:450 (-),score=43.76 TRINITY_DN2927_c0_g1_i3:447-1796(-)
MAQGWQVGGTMGSGVRRRVARHLLLLALLLSCAVSVCPLRPALSPRPQPSQPAMAMPSPAQHSVPLRAHDKGSAASSPSRVTPPRPSIPLQFKAIVRTQLEEARAYPAYPQTQKGVWSFSSIQNLSRFDLDWGIPSPWELYTSSLLARKLVDGWEVKNGLCHLPYRSYTDVFNWLPNKAKYVGPDHVNGFAVDVWEEIFRRTVTLAVLQSNASIPVQLNISHNVISFDPPSFKGYPPSANVSFLFDPPQSCKIQGGFVCPEGPVIRLNITRFHGQDSTLENRNVADVLGDASYICENPRADDYISFYEIEVNSTWGQYAQCNDGQCPSRNTQYVGRESVHGWGYRGGQCAPENPNTGTWYSLPGNLACPSGSPVQGSCKWKTIRKFKTITLDCLMSKGFASACTKDHHMPFVNAAEVLRDALQFGPEHGGCPDIETDVHSFAFAAEPSH